MSHHVRMSHRVCAFAVVACCLAACRGAPVPAAGDALAAELLRRGAEDQRVRSRDFASGSDAERRAWVDEALAVDRDNTAWLGRIVDEQGWPARSVVGEEASLAAFLIVQHADQDPAFQERCLPLLEEAAARGEVKASHVAYLTDRVRTKQGRPQVYGTQYSGRQPSPGAAMEYELPLVEDVERLDERRAAVGLPPWIEYERRMAEMHGRAPAERPRAATGR